MSEIITDKLTGKTAAGDVTITSEGGSATMQLQQGVAKVWVKFSGTGTIAVDDSLNVGSLTDHGTGNYQVNFSNNMGNADYSDVCNSSNFMALNGVADTTSGLRVGTYGSSFTLADAGRVFSVAQGDLA